MTRQVRLADGRTVEYVAIGDPAGPPVLLMHGTPSTGGVAQVLADQAQRAGVHLIAPSRPGYAGSTPHTPGLTGAAEDMLEFADLLGIDRFTAMGVSGGGPYALALAAVAPERLVHVALHAGTGPYFELNAPTDEEAAERAAVAAYVAGDRETAVAQLTEAADRDFGPLRRLTGEEFAAGFASMAPPNETWLANRPAERAMFMEDMRIATRSSDGYVYDVLSWGSAWDIDLTTIARPVRLVYCVDDRMVPVAHAHWLAERLSDTDLALAPGAHGDASFGRAMETFERARG